MISRFVRMSGVTIIMHSVHVIVVILMFQCFQSSILDGKGAGGFVFKTLLINQRAYAQSRGPCPIFFL